MNKVIIKGKQDLINNPTVWFILSLIFCFYTIMGNSDSLTFFVLEKPLELNITQKLIGVSFLSYVTASFMATILTLFSCILIESITKKENGQKIYLKSLYPIDYILSPLFVSSYCVAVLCPIQIKNNI